MDTQQGFQLSDIRGILRRRGAGMGALALAPVLVAVVSAGWIPNRYVAGTTLLIEPQSISQKLVEPGVPQTDLNNRLHLLQMQILSRSRLSQVIDQLRVYPELEDELTRAEVIDLMRDDISLIPVLPELETAARAQAGVRTGELVVTTFRLQFSHQSAKVAAEVANRLSNSFIEEHLTDRTRTSGDTREFIQEELRRLSVEIQRVEREIAEIKTANAGTLPEDFDANQRLHERLVDGIRDAQREISIASSDEAFYNQQALAGGGSEDLYAGQVVSPRRRLELLELQITEYQSRGFTEKHPDLISAREEVQRLRAEVKRGAEDPENTSPAQQNARFEQQRASLRRAAATQEMERLKQTLASVEERLTKTPKVAEQLSALDREHEHLFGAYQDYSRKRLEAGVAADMESRQKGERFSVLEQAVPPTEPSSPNRPLLIAVGVLAGLALAVAYALGVEAVDDSFHNPRRLQDRFGIPVLAAIPEVQMPSDIAAQRTRWIRRLAIAGATAVFTIVVSAAGYWWQGTRSAASGNPEAAPGQAAQAG